MPTIAQQLREQGIQQGREQGIQQGQLQGRIRTLQEVLGRPVSTLEELSQLNPEKLQQLADELNETFRRS